MPALVAGIHVFRAPAKTWMAGTIPAMTGQRQRKEAAAPIIASAARRDTRVGRDQN
jgi:hypothetical protein